MANEGEQALTAAISGARAANNNQVDLATKLAEQVGSNSQGVVAAMDAAMKAKKEQDVVDRSAEARLAASFDVTPQFVQAANDARASLDRMHQEFNAAEAERNLTWSDNFFTKLGHELTGNTANAHVMAAAGIAQQVQNTAAAVQHTQVEIDMAKQQEFAKIHNTPEYQKLALAKTEADAELAKHNTLYAIGTQQVAAGKSVVDATAERVKIEEANVRANRDKLLAADTSQMNALQIRQHQVSLDAAEVELKNIHANNDSVNTAASSLAPVLGIPAAEVRAKMALLTPTQQQSLVAYGVNPDAYSLEAVQAMNRMTKTLSPEAQATIASAPTKALIDYHATEATKFFTSIYDAKEGKFKVDSPDLKAAFGNDDKALAAFFKLPEAAQRAQIEGIAANRTSKLLASGASVWAQNVSVRAVVAANPAMVSNELRPVFAVANTPTEAIAALYTHMQANKGANSDKLIAEFSKVYATLAQTETDAQRRKDLKGAKPVAGIMANVQMPGAGLFGNGMQDTPVDLMNPTDVAAKLQAKAIFDARAARGSTDFSSAM